MQNGVASTGNYAVDNVLQESEIGQFILKYKNIVFPAVVLIIVGVIGGGIYNYFHQQSLEKYRNEVSLFRSGAMKDYSDKKIDVKQLTQAYNELAKKVDGHSVMALATLEAVDSLIKNQSKEEALGLLEQSYVSSWEKDPYVAFFINSRKAVVYEDLGKNDLALKTLEKMASSSTKIFEGKLNLDLGRLYLKNNDKEKAKNSFQKIIDNPSQQDMVPLARIYLSKIGA